MQTFEAFTTRFNDIVWTPYLFFLLLGCGLIFSIVTKFVQWRALTHGIRCVRGQYDNPDDVGHISHFQALCAALSATIGLGNIAGVATAVTVGGPGAVFWMWVVGFFGMSLKFVECTLSVMFRDERDVPDPSAPALIEQDAESGALDYDEEPPAPGIVAQARGEVRGGPMWYIQKALVEPLKARGSSFWIVFKVAAVLYAVVIAIASFGGGNMYQSWNVGNTVQSTFNIDPSYTGLAIAALVALVIIGGIKRIGAVAGKLVPTMCVMYVFAAMVVLFQNMPVIPEMLALIVKSAFTQVAGEGAFAGVGVYAAFQIGLKRALFSNEGGQGSAAIAHAAAKTDEPIREGAVAAIGPFIDTLVICTMTALVILSTGTWTRPAVGTVTAIEQRVVETDKGPREMTTLSVQMTPPENIPDTLREPHYADVATAGVGLWVLVQRDQGEAPERLKGKSGFLIDKTAEELAGLASFEMTLSLDEQEKDPESFAKKVALLEPGQPVHLALDAAQITRFALDTLGVGVGRWIILVGVCLFAFSTMISWSYYGEKGIEYLLGARAILPYKCVFILAIYFGCTIQGFETVYDFSDAMVGLTVFCNLPVCLILLPTLVRAARIYFDILDSGRMPRTK